MKNQVNETDLGGDNRELTLSSLPTASLPQQEFEMSDFSSEHSVQSSMEGKSVTDLEGKGIPTMINDSCEVISEHTEINPNSQLFEHALLDARALLAKLKKQRDFFRMECRRITIERDRFASMQCSLPCTDINCRGCSKT